MAKDPITDLKDQTTLAMAALGVAFAQTLVELDESNQALAILRRKVADVYLDLEKGGQFDAEVMVGSFSRSLHDKKYFPKG
jgi:hypothetical protein